MKGDQLDKLCFFWNPFPGIIFNLVLTCAYQNVN